MALDFPTSPVLGQPFDKWVWDGEKWVIPDSSSPTPTVPTWEVVYTDLQPTMSEIQYFAPLNLDGSYQAVRVNMAVSVDTGGVDDGAGLDLLVRNEDDTAWFSWNAMRSAWSGTATTWNSGVTATNEPALTLGVASRYGMRTHFDFTLLKGNALWQIDSYQRGIANFAGATQNARHVTGYVNTGYTAGISQLRLNVDSAYTISGLNIIVEALKEIT